MQFINKIKLFLKIVFQDNKIILFIIIFFLVFYSTYLAKNLKTGIIPDEKTHILISFHFSKTLGIPPNSEDIIRLGSIVEQKPYLFYWVNGRVINLIHIISPYSNDFQVLFLLRILNVIYSTGIVIFTYLTSKELIHNKWWQLLPTFLLTNTLMFVFLSSGVNYDNLANFFSVAGLYFLVRVFHGKDFYQNSLLWMISICLGTLVKMPILPLVLSMAIVWVYFVLRNRKKIPRINLAGKLNYILFVILLLLVIGNIKIYGVNLYRYGALEPKCEQVLSKSLCELSPFHTRLQELGLDHKMTMIESIQLGYPQPISYFFDSWINHIMIRTYGILGHLVYYPHLIIIFYRLLFFWIFVMAIKYWKKPSFSIISILGISLFYVFVVFVTNYNSELTFGFKQIAIQGRYIFPVIGLFYVLVAYTLSKITNPKIKLITLAYTLILFILGGPIKFIHPSYIDIFSDWFIK